VGVDDKAQNPPAQFTTLSLTCSFSKSYTRRRPFSLMVSWSIGLLGVLALGDDDDDGGGGRAGVGRVCMQQ